MTFEPCQAKAAARILSTMPVPEMRTSHFCGRSLLSGLSTPERGGTTEPRRCAVEAEYEDIRGRYGACVDGEGYK